MAKTRLPTEPCAVCEKPVSITVYQRSRKQQGKPVVHHDMCYTILQQRMVHACACRQAYYDAVVKGLQWLMPEVHPLDWHRAFYFYGELPDIFSYSGRPGDRPTLLSMEEWSEKNGQ